MGVYYNPQVLALPSGSTHTKASRQRTALVANQVVDPGMLKWSENVDSGNAICFIKLFTAIVHQVSSYAGVGHEIVDISLFYYPCIVK